MSGELECLPTPLITFFHSYLLTLQQYVVKYRHLSDLWMQMGALKTSALVKKPQSTACQHQNTCEVHSCVSTSLYTSVEKYFNMPPLVHHPYMLCCRATKIFTFGRDWVTSKYLSHSSPATGSILFLFQLQPKSIQVCLQVRKPDESVRSIESCMGFVIVEWAVSEHILLDCGELWLWGL